MEGPNRVVDLLTVLSGRALTQSNASVDPGTHDFHRMLLTWCRSSTENLLLLSRLKAAAHRLRRSHHGPYID